ncbi:MAG: FHA domain-containing protein [Ktedonobacteraceae bacterium]|nr:FHA domain-containing protein [Ktedonobacteraceae bacterium]
MDARFYNSEDIDIEQLANDLVNVYIAQGYQAQQFGDQQQRLVQLKKGGDFEAIIGMQAALTVTIQKTAGGTLAMIGQQKWLDKAAVGAVGIVALPVLWPLALTAGVGALRQASLSNQVLNMVDGLVRQQRPGLVAGPIPMQLLPQVQHNWGNPPQQQTPVYIPPPQQTPAYIPPPRVVVSDVTPAPPAPPRPVSTPGSTRLHCPNCNTPYEPGDTFCSGCGRSLAPAKQYCSNCNFEIKPGASFCPKCGASTFQTGTQQTQVAPNRPLPPPSAPYTPPAPPTAPQPTVTYTKPATPVYTPPSQPAQQPAPLYTPPPKPPTPVYTPPQTPVYTPPPTPPTVEAKPAQVTPAPEPPPYVPPVTQNPSVVPQPKVTLVPSNEPKKEKPAPPRPEKQYYIPSSQAQTGTEPTLPAQTPPAPHAGTHVPPPAPATPIKPRSASKAASDVGAPWGSLQFTDGPQIELTGERAVVGRYDHDLGGIKPEVDLAQVQGADTVSRIHAAFEHIGSTYTLTDLNSTNATRINGKRLEPDKATPINDGDTLQFGKITCTFKKL